MSNPLFVNIHTHPTPTFTLQTPTAHLSLHQTVPTSLQVHLTPSHLTVAMHSTPAAAPSPGPTIRNLHPPLLLAPDYTSSGSISGASTRSVGGFAAHGGRVLAAHPDDMFRVGRYEGRENSWELLAKRVKGLDMASGSGSGGEREGRRGYGSGRSRRR
ncbi:uncharacterized protein H6S33_006517 [Morchella sextelata]|uniref:uncharacterized protein n=1 Tax=Morchella sextelata TaxID=1174677 RepID=UPI001D039316|nr:uncharacterized protein H6S33_006517 [Morchella sextelata]KAH0604849.1 hypothetical protein H6S33_006517 [Morchella sextelata]